MCLLYIYIMRPKKATADKAKEKDQSDTEDIEPNRMERLEDELRELRDRLFDTNRQITETRLRSHQKLID